VGILNRILPGAPVALVLMLTGCGGGSFSLPGFGSAPPPEPAVQPLPAPELPSSIRATEVIGRWGYAAYHREPDRARTETAARSQCSHPVVIGQGPSGGVMMYPADQTQLAEFHLKGGPGGRNFIGLRGQSEQDREVVAFDGRVMVLRYVDPEINGRYGIGVYVRCAPSPGGVAQRGKAK
jgi:hypothetical protein